jgi:hypothetical protein
VNVRGVGTSPIIDPILPDAPTDLLAQSDDIERSCATKL